MFKSTNLCTRQVQLVDGVVADPSFAKTPPPIVLLGDEAKREAVLRASRERFARPRSRVEERIGRWFFLGGAVDTGGRIKENLSMQQKNFLIYAYSLLPTHLP